MQHFYLIWQPELPSNFAINSSQGPPVICMKCPGRNALLLFAMQAGIFSSLCYNSCSGCCTFSEKRISFRWKQDW